MPLDSSIYQSLKPIEMPSYGDSQAKAMRLSEMGMQNQRMANQMGQEEDAQKVQKYNQKILAMGSAADALAGMSPEDRAAAGPKILQNLISTGQLSPDEVPSTSTWDDSWFKGAHAQIMPIYKQTKDYLDKQKIALDNKKIESDNKYSDESRDPNSELSKRAQSVGSKLAPGVNLNGLSYDQFQKLAPLAEKQQEANIRSDDRNFFRGQAKDERAQKDQDKTYTELRNHLETFRGNSAAQQAAKDVLSGKKALAMLENKDPNTLTTQDLSLLAGELAKVATSGVPTEHGIQQLMPNNLSTKFAELQNFLSSKPTDANAGEYVKKNMSYLKDMVGVASQSLGDLRKNILKGYKNRIRKDDYDSVISDYGLAEVPQSGAKVRVSNGKETLVIDPSDLDHAKADGYQQVK